MTRSLPARIALIVAATIVLIATTAALSIIWMIKALDHQAVEQSEIQVGIVRDNLLSRIHLITVDYAKWDPAYEAVQGGTDVEWLLRNIGSTAIVGKSVQLAVIWGGGFEQDIGWMDDGTVEARPNLVPAATLKSAESSLADAMPGSFNSTEFFEWRGDELFVMAVSHFEPLENPEVVPEAERLGGLLLMGVRLDAEIVGEFARSLSLTGAEITVSPPVDRPSLALRGIDGESVAYFAWDRPRPGTVLFQRMLPILFLLTVGAVALAVLNVRFAKRSAHNLVVAEQEASRTARTDALTGLFNRGAFNKALAEPASAGERAILFLDIDDFKRINDSIGHAAGDQVIVCVAKRLANIVGPGCLLARVGGDEFVFLLTGSDVAARTIHLAARASESLARPFSVFGHHMQLRTAIGYAVQMDNITTGNDLVRQADLAMYEAKRHKGSAPVAFSSLLETAARNAALIERNLRKALERPGEISVVYQPITDMRGRFVQAEALARWTSPDLGSVPPDQFIAVAEKSGLMVDLGRKIIELVCRDLFAHPNLKISFNISPLQLMAPDFIPLLVSTLNQHSIDIARVEIELTESVIVDDTRLAAERLDELRAVGFSIALDDFGTGYSSMGYLARLQFQTLKIDRSFVSKVRGSASDVSVIDGMIRIAHGLGMKVVCEGVETAEELSKLEWLGSDLAQGYHLDPPLPIASLAGRWLASPHSASEAGGVVVPLWGSRA